MFPEYTLDNLPARLSEPARSEVVVLIKERDTPGEGDFTRSEHRRFGKHGGSKETQIEAAGEVVVYWDGGQLRITRRSAYNRRIALLIQSNLSGQPRLKREVKTAFKKKPRPRTEAELKGLRKGNAQRAEEARRRRREKEAEAVP
jgi:hypothetical protein